MMDMMTSFARHLACGIGLVLFLPQFVLSQDATLTATKIDGSRQSGNLVAWNADAITLQKDEQTVTIAATELLRVQWPNVPAKDNVARTFFELVDGTRLPHQTYVTDAGKAMIAVPLADQPLTISTKRIRFVQLAADADWQALEEHELDDDLLMIRKKDSQSFDYLSGILGEVSSNQVKFNWDGEVIPVKRTKVAALAYYHARQPEAQDVVCWLSLQGGGRLPVANIALKEGVAIVNTTAGWTFSIPVEKLQSADYSQGKLAYLSDLKPVRQKWTPRINLPTSAELIRQHGLPRRDQSFAGSAITLLWPTEKSGIHNGELKTYSKGLALRSRTELRYRLPEGMQRFLAVAGIDPETADQGNVMLEIFAGRRSVWRSEIVGGAVPTEIKVALGDARELRIVVDYGQNLDFGDRLHLAEARLSQ